MKKITIPKNINATIDSEISEFDFSYTDELKKFTAEEMEIHTSLLSDLKFAWFTGFKKVTPTFSIPHSDVIAAFLLDYNIVLMRVEFNNEVELCGSLAHEVGHFLTLRDTFLTLFEGFAVYYERKWYIKENKVDLFHQNENYMCCLNLIDLIKNSIFNGNENELLKAIQKDNNESFIDILNSYLNNQNCMFSIRELLFLADIMFHHRGIRFQSKTFRNQQPYFYRAFDYLHYEAFPIIFNKNSTSEELNNVYKKLSNYIAIVKKCLQILDDFNCDPKDYPKIERMYINILAQEFHKWDFGECFSTNTQTLETFASNIPAQAFELLTENFTNSQSQDMQR